MTGPLERHRTVEVPVNLQTAEPRFFGHAGQEIFGWLHPGADGARGRAGVVLCGTLGIESLSIHRALRVLADSLAQYQLPTLRFDYSGTGDSMDPPGGAIRLTTCIANVRTAIQVVREQCSVDRVFVVGIRLGALLAVEAAELEEVSGLILWGPVVSGKRFVREWSMIAGSAEPSAVPADHEAVHAAGFSLDRKFLDELASHSLLQAKPLGSPPCLVVEREELPPEDRLVGRLQELGMATDRCRPGGFLAGVLAEPHLTEVPVRAIREIREWIADKSRTLPLSSSLHERPSVPMAPMVVLPETRAAERIRVCERFLGRDEASGLFGIVSEPIDPNDGNGRSIILLNSGSVHHIGPGRMYVELSRRLASKGFRVCRADLGGLGDSPARAGSRENDPYALGAIDDVGHLVRALSSISTGSRMALAGLCSGAWAAFHGGLVVEGVTDVVLINPDFYGERSVVGERSASPRPTDFSRYKRSVRQWNKWKKLLMGRADLAKAGRVLWNQALLTAATWRARMAGERHRLDDDLIRLAEAEVRVGFIFSPGDSGVDFLRMHGRLGVERLGRLGLLRQATVSDSDHIFSSPGSRLRLETTLSEWLHCSGAVASQGPGGGSPTV